MAVGEVREGGSLAVIYSLAGVPGRKGEGRVIRCSSYAPSAGVRVALAGSNPNRVWMTVYNNGPGEIQLCLNPDDVTTAPWFISSKGYLVINALLPYTGGLYATAVGALCYIYVAEASNS